MGNSNDSLHIEEIKKRFKNYSSISVDDFNEFYREIYGSINRKTVSWKIYKLKKEGIIKNIARGQYAFENSSGEKSEVYIVFTMDIIKSTDIDFRKFNRKLEEKVTDLNSIINKVYNYDRRYYISQGDEIQILLPFSENIGKLLILTLSSLYPFKVRYGMSIGELNCEIKANSWDMNGPIFWNARDQLEKLKKVSDYEGKIISGYNQTDRFCNNILTLINSAIRRITDKQWEAIKCELSMRNLDKCLDDLGIQKTSYYDRLKASNIDEVLTAFKTIFGLVNNRRVIK